METTTNDLAVIEAVFRYVPGTCWVIHTPARFAGQPYAGASARLVYLDTVGREAMIEIANGDRYTVPTDEISIRQDGITTTEIPNPAIGEIHPTRKSVYDSRIVGYSVRLYYRNEPAVTVRFTESADGTVVMNHPGFDDAISVDSPESYGPFGKAWVKKFYRNRDNAVRPVR